MKMISFKLPLYYAALWQVLSVWFCTVPLLPPTLTCLDTGYFWAESPRTLSLKLIKEDLFCNNSPMAWGFARARTVNGCDFLWVHAGMQGSDNKGAGSRGTQPGFYFGFISALIWVSFLTFLSQNVFICHKEIIVI